MKIRRDVLCGQSRVFERMLSEEWRKSSKDTEDKNTLEITYEDPQAVVDFCK
jgi:hypothetical protein